MIAMVPGALWRGVEWHGFRFWKVFLLSAKTNKQSAASPTDKGVLLSGEKDDRVKNYWPNGSTFYKRCAVMNFSSTQPRRFPEIPICLLSPPQSRGSAFLPPRCAGLGLGVGVKQASICFSFHFSCIKFEGPKKLRADKARCLPSHDLCINHHIHRISSPDVGCRFALVIICSTVKQILDVPPA